ncbi:ABC transporter permease [Lutibacter sp. B2]|nr:ABC transporter permease [Lutibacter sp. B2]
MGSFLVLLLGEIQRMKKYNILAASVLISLIWIGIMHFTGIHDVTQIFPLFIFLDVTSMSILLIGVTMFFEKQEGIIKTLMVSPISKAEYILAKTFANSISNIETLIILYVYAKLFKEININMVGLFSAVVLVSFFHSLIGFVFTYYSKDFTRLLMWMITYSFVFMTPVLLEQVGMIRNEGMKKIFYVIPTKTSMILLNASTGGIKPWEVYLSVFYLLIISILLYFVVLKKFDEFAIKESGV